jgi:hypothetical protein
MTKVKKAKAANVVNLAAFRETRKALSSASQEASQEGPHIATALWCLEQYDNQPRIRPSITDWEINFLESMSTWDGQVSERQEQCLQRIALRIERLTSGSPAA